MKLTEAQIKQVIGSSIEARRELHPHVLTERQLRSAIRQHIQTGEPINELLGGLIDALKGAMGDIFGGFVDGFKSAYGAYESKGKEAEASLKSEMEAELGGEFPDNEKVK